MCVCACVHARACVCVRVCVYTCVLTGVNFSNCLDTLALECVFHNPYSSSWIVLGENAPESFVRKVLRACSEELHTETPEARVARAKVSIMQLLLNVMQ